MFHAVEWTLFEPLDIYNYPIIKQNVKKRYLGTEYSIRVNKKKKEYDAH